MNVHDILHMLLDGTISVEQAIEDIKVLQNAEMPTAPVVKLSRHKDGVWDLFVSCPHCGETHKHGGGNGDVPYLGHRNSHCHKGNGYHMIIK